MEEIKKGFSNNLVVKSNDENLEEATNEYIDALEEEYLDYMEYVYEEARNFGAKKWKSVFFQPEILSKRSPLTILNGPWGSGKTYFIERVAYNFEDKKEENKRIFKSIIILNTWKFSYSNDLVEEIMSEVFLSLCKNNPKIKDTILLIAKFLFNIASPAWMKKFTFTQSDKKDYKKLVEEAEKNIKKTIIFFDNIERLGSRSWDVIKAIHKLSEFSNFLFVLPMNLDDLLKNPDNLIGEYPIEKFIDIKIFNFQQGYLEFFQNLGFNEELSKNLNEISSERIDGSNLSIREIEQRTKSNIINKSKNNIKEDDFKVIKIFLIKIWNPSISRENIINKYIEEYISNWSKMQEIINQFYRELPQNHEIYNRTFSIGALHKPRFQKTFKSIQEEVEKHLNIVKKMVNEGDIDNIENIKDIFEDTMIIYESIFNNEICSHIEEIFNSYDPVNSIGYSYRAYNIQYEEEKQNFIDAVKLDILNKIDESL